MKGFIAIIILSTAAIHAFGAHVVKLTREHGAIAFSVQKGYGVQKDAKHELVITSVATGKPVKTVNSFRGNIASEDKKYFDRLNAVEVPLDAGKVHVSGRIFYCSFEQKFCSVQKVDEEL